MLATSRPVGTRFERFGSHFCHLQLSALTEEQQAEVIRRRVSAERAPELLR